MPFAVRGACVDHAPNLVHTGQIGLRVVEHARAEGHHAVDHCDHRQPPLRDRALPYLVPLRELDVPFPLPMVKLLLRVRDLFDGLGLDDDAANPGRAKRGRRELLELEKVAKGKLEQSGQLVEANAQLLRSSSLSSGLSRGSRSRHSRPALSIRRKLPRHRRACSRVSRPFPTPVRPPGTAASAPSPSWLAHPRQPQRLKPGGEAAPRAPRGRIPASYDMITTSFGWSTSPFFPHGSACPAAPERLATPRTPRRRRRRQ